MSSDDGAPPEPEKTVDEMLAALPGFTSQAEADAKIVARVKILAEQTKDPLKVQCVDNELFEIKGKQNVLDLLASEIPARIQDGDEGFARSQFADAQTYAAEIRGHKETALGCVGDELSIDGEGNIIVDGPDITDDVTDETPFDGDGEGGDDIEPGVHVTPFT
ncbi:MAG: hypothetical protein R2939_03540 [Kofleriaceae bacterium]